MQHPLQEHIARLEEKIVVLRWELRDPDLPEYQRSERELALKNAEEAVRLSQGVRTRTESYLA